MANWISSKLKVAETFLQQIDQQAAESLKKNDKPGSDELNNETPTKIGEVVPLKDQLKKRTPETNDLIGKLNSDHKLNVIKNSHVRDKEVATVVDLKPPSNIKSTLTDSDWTELLSSPSTPPAVNRSNGVSGIRGLRKDGRRQGTSGSNLSALEVKRNYKTQNSIPKISPKSKSVTASENEVNSGRSSGRRSNGEDSRFLGSVDKTSIVEPRTDVNYSEGREEGQKGESVTPVVEHKDEGKEGRNGMLDTLGDGGKLHSVDNLPDAVPLSSDKDQLSETMPVIINGESDLKMGAKDDSKRFSNIVGSDKYNVGPRRSASLKRGSRSESDDGSGSETDSGSTSGSESEGEREERRRMRAQILAEKAAAKAVEVIKERENMVARLEGEKQSLDKILEERAKQQAQEASELQTNTMEMMEAVDLEKRKHNNTRMEALPRMAKLETANADLAKSLATAQWNLEVEVNRVSDLRQQIELREATHEELRRKIDNTNQTGNLVVAKGFEFEREILEAEYSFVTDKIARLQGKANTLETNIEMARKEIENPSEVEVELKRRLGQLTDHLIQKQAQVEALSSEKATLLFRIEAISRLLDENKSAMPNSSSREDLESGIWDLSNSKLRPMLEKRIQSGRQHLGSLVQQLDSIFCAGAVYLRRNSTARLWSFVYLICLHLWVVYILMSHSSVSDEARSGAIFSLENINNTGGV